MSIIAAEHTSFLLTIEMQQATALQHAFKVALVFVGLLLPPFIGMSSLLSCYLKKTNPEAKLQEGDLTLMFCPYLIQLLVLFVFFGMNPPHESSLLCFLCAPTLTGAGTGQWCRCRRSGGNCRCIHGIGGSRTGGFKASTVERKWWWKWYLWNA